MGRSEESFQFFIVLYTVKRRHVKKSMVKVVKEHFGPQPTAGRFLARVRALRVDATALDAMNRQVAARRREPARALAR